MTAYAYISLYCILFYSITRPTLLALAAALRCREEKNICDMPLM